MIALKFSKEIDLIFSNFFNIIKYQWFVKQHNIDSQKEDFDYSNFKNKSEKIY